MTSLVSLLALVACRPEPIPRFVLEVGPPRVELEVESGDCADATLEVVNLGTVAGVATLHPLHQTCAVDAWDVTAGSVAVAPGGRATVTVRYCPEVPTACEAALPVSVAPEGDIGETFTIALVGRSTSPDDDGDGVRVADGDCDDLDATVHAGVEEMADGVDQDCDGVVDDGTEVYDDDGDGFAERDGDCDDADATLHPGAAEAPDGRDEDCDGVVDDGTVLVDDDGDGWSEGGGDCNDWNAAVAPTLPELPDGLDQDCDGAVDDGTDFGDDDGDGVTEAGGDCDDGRPDRRPGAVEIADGIDQDCDGVVDEDTSRADDDGDGFTEAQGDCNDDNALVFPLQHEVFNAVDDDCDARIDDGTEAWDDDGDGMSERAGDCDDADPSVVPGAPEAADGADDDCDGTVDEGTTASDDDLDGVSEDGGDCNDGNADVLPGTLELQNGLDDDCDGVLDEEVHPLGLLEPPPGELEATLDGYAPFVPASHGIDALLPAIDWRSVAGTSWLTGVRNQGSSGTCVPHATLGGLESAYRIQAGQDGTLDLSEQNLTDCNAQDANIVSSGYSITAMADEVVAGGTVTEAADPYVVGALGASQRSQYQNTCPGLPPTHTAREAWRVQGDEAVKAALHLGPLLTRMDVYSDFQLYDAGVYRPSPSAAFSGGHAVTLVGYSDADGAWIVKNSWGTGWGEGGYARVAYGTSGLATYAFLFEVDAAGFENGLGLLDYFDTPATLPQGATCGLVHSAVGGADCLGHDATVSCPAGFVRRFGGDDGEPAGEGYAWCEASGSAPADLSVLPDGAVCGLVHTAHQVGEGIRCLGVDPLGGSCPAGFTWRFGGDDGLGAGQGFVWCELTAGCAGGSCLSAGLEDTVCGLGHDVNDAGTCLGVSPTVDDTCPAGFSFVHGGDHGLAAGQGFDWCVGG